jgi:iron complex transport system ATP-binding protein
MLPPTAVIRLDSATSTLTAAGMSGQSNIPFLELVDATVVLGGARVLDALTITIPLRQHTAILGPNGAGKSTLMKLLTLQLYPLAGDARLKPSRSFEPGAELSGVDGKEREGRLRAEGASGSRAEPVSGKEREGFSRAEPSPIRVFGRDRWDVFELRTQMGIVSADLHDKFVHGNSNGVVTGADAVVSGFFATQGVFAHQPVTDAMRARAADALDRVEAGHLARRTLDTLSTGEARRVLIARALVHDPAVLVLDEPTRGLDLVARHQFMERVRAIAREGTTILLVTHYVEEIIPEIDRVILLARGRIAGDGSKESVLTAARLTDVFGAPLAVERANGYYHVRVADSATRTS